MDKLRMTSTDLIDANIDKLAELFPSVVTETRGTDGNPKRAIDFDLLRQELSDHVVEAPQERFQLDWPGKRSATFAANAPIAKTLRPVRADSVDFDTTKNVFIEGDNLEALKLLQESYLGKVKLIYIDPPYNTGKDFVYADAFSQSTYDYLRESGQRDGNGAQLTSNTEANGRFHSDWLSMMYSRLKLARNLLADNGAIFISIDDNEVGQLRSVCDEIFGKANFVAQIVWQKRTSPDARKRIGAGHEYILLYVRSAISLEATLSPIPLDEKDRAAFSNPDNDPRGPWVSSDFTAPGYRPNQMYEIDTPSGQKVGPPPGRCWMNIESEYKAQVSEGRFWFGPDGKGIPRRKTYLSERNGKSAWTWWPNSEVGHTQEGTREVRDLFHKSGPTYFDFPKPVRLMQRIVQLATRPQGDEVVLDFFAGSSTMAHAVMAQNASDGGTRRFIMVQLDEAPSRKSDAAKAGYKSIAEISRERIRLASRKVVEEYGLMNTGFDVGFRALKVDTTNMLDVWHVPSETNQLALDELAGSVKADRSGEDLLFQVLLDWGLELTMPVSVEQADGHEVLIVEDGALIACFDSQVSSELVRNIAQREPLRAVFRDLGFDTDADRINAEQVFRELSPATDVRVI